MEKRDPFNLSSLPELEPPHDGWQSIAGQLNNGRRQKRIRVYAIAATVVLAVTVGLVLPKLSIDSDLTQLAVTKAPPGTGIKPDAEQISDSADLAQVAKPDSVAASNADQLQSLKNLSGRLEDNLRRLRSGVGGMPADVIVYQVELEDLVAQVDEALMWQPDSSQLWQQRVNLLLDLSQIYGAGLRREYQPLASL